jgi:hypothetical protein
MAMQIEQQAPYPVRLHMEYPERLSRLSTAFRLILVIPVLIFAALVSGGNFNLGWNDSLRGGGAAAGSLGGGVVVAIWAAVLVKGRIPRWLFDFQVGLNRFTTRAFAYAALLTDRYPAFEGAWVLQYDVDYPERVSRWRLLFWKLITSIPHFIVLAFLSVAAFVVVIIAWFTILFTGTFPRGLHTFVVGVGRWWARVEAYVQSLTDAFPPFSLDEDAGPADTGTYAASAVLGGIIFSSVVAAAIGLAIFLAIYLNRSKSLDVDLNDVLAGDVPAAQAGTFMDDVGFTLISAQDPAEGETLAARQGYRILAFTLEYRRLDDDEGEFRIGEVNEDDIDRDTVRLRASGRTYKPVLLTLDGVPAPIDLPRGARGEVVAYFEIRADARLDKLRAYPNTGNNRHITWNLR